ncbi:nuclear transport factor 2 family protein [Rubellimicrobium aerolatum]|uniref:Nuclear transport factor 2 family protein n=1 Tax=Rubellimicrobium aerolatum TaxID=490979 RepID=A0ABW0SFH4_9RHOB|nr:nuclear transport factor 2 family protein [Rubellimicrobium aerolatum]MBP1807150.1 ketosteroid isomerase-like protein [Rubellimicrobium aerolatum]
MPGMAQTFANALQETEESRDPEPLVRLFAEDAELRNLAIAHQGIDGARQFWETYLHQFESIRSEFSHLIESEGQAALVWTSDGTMKDGRPISYRGVSVIEFAEGKVRRFETIYDSAAFVRPEAG